MHALNPVRILNAFCATIQHSRQSSSSRTCTLKWRRTPAISIPSVNLRRFSAQAGKLTASEPEDEDEVDEEVVIQDEGDYDMIMPPKRRPQEKEAEKPIYSLLPQDEKRLPPYATPDAVKRFQKTGEHKEGGEDGDGLIQLGAVEEWGIRSAAALAARILRQAGALVNKYPNVTTEQVDDLVAFQASRYKAYPSPLNYRGFPRACCTSINNIVAHGIPDQRPLRSGDIVNVDVTIYHRGFHGDTSKTFAVGDVDAIGRELIAITEEALEAGIAACAPGRPFRDIARAIHGVVDGKGYIVCPAFTGHAIGRAFHRKPWIYHDLNDEPDIMKPGHCFTIEPCIIKGSDPTIAIWRDGWTATTASLARSAQAEHMVLITEKGADILTRDDKWLLLPTSEKLRRLNMSAEEAAATLAEEPEDH